MTSTITTPPGLAEAERSLLVPSRGWTGGDQSSGGGHWAVPGHESGPISVGRVEARLLGQLVLAYEADRVLEIGTAFGWSTTWMAHALQSTGGRILTVDDRSEGGFGLKGAETAHALWEQAGVDGCIDELVGRSPEELDAREPMAAQLAFVDGDHWGEQPLLDYRAAARHLAPRGCIVLHDAQPYFDVLPVIGEAVHEGFTAVPLHTSGAMCALVRPAEDVTLVLDALAVAREAD